MQMFRLKKQTNVSNFPLLEVVARGSETQLQVGENLNKITQRAKGLIDTPRHIIPT